MLVFNRGCGFESLANGFKFSGVWKMHDVWPFVSGKVEQHLVWITSLAHFGMVAASSLKRVVRRVPRGLNSACTSPALVEDAAHSHSFPRQLAALFHPT